MKTRNKARIALTDRDKRVLGLLYRFRLLSRDQLMLAAPFGSFTRANTRLGALVRARLVSRKAVPIYLGKGSAQSLYYLGRESVNVLHAEPAAVTRQVRRVARWEMRQVEHVVGANGVLVDFEVGLRSLHGATLLSFRTEPELRTLFLDCALVPDGWVAWVQEGRRFNCFIEVDLHHEGLGQWRKKVLDYLNYASSGVHEDLFGFASFRVVVLAKSRQRLESLRRIAEPAGGLFLFVEMEKISSKTLFEAVWQRASGGGPIGLTAA